MPLSRRQLSFLLKFGALLALFYVAIALAPVDAHVVVPFTRGITRVSGAVLNALGERVIVTGTIISGAFAVDIRNGCNGIEAVVFVCAAMLAFEAPMRQRLLGALIAALALETLNVIRIVTLYVIGQRRPEIFQTAHLAIWQTLMFAAAVFLFLAWTAKVAPRDAATSA